MRSVSLFTSLVLAALLGVFSSGTVRAQSNSTGTPPGVTCSTINGVYTCVGGTNGSGYTCTTAADGSRSCTGDNNGSGYTCTTLPSGELSCKGNSGASGGTGGGSSGPGFVTKLTSWLSGAMSSFFGSLMAFLRDLIVGAVAAILSLFALMVSAIPVPDFIKTYSLGTLLSAAGPDVGWFLNTLKIAQGLAIVGSGYAFRLLRKFLTLFQW